MAKLIKRSAIALHQQLKDIIKSKIETGEYREGGLIPSTAELCKQYKVSITPVRRAVHELILEGFLKGMAGKGTFVISNRENTRSSSNRLIGISFPGMASSPFFMEILSGAEEVVRAAGYHLVAVNTGEDSGKESQLLLDLKEKGIQGTIVVPVAINRSERDNKALSRVLSHNFPVVFVDRKIPGFQVDYVASDNLTGGYRAAQYLIGLGHRQIALILGIEVNTVQARLAGYRKALEEFQIEFDLSLVKHTYVEGQQEHSGFQNTVELLRQAVSPTAIFACNDTIALGVYGACRSLGIHIPGDISVIGYDNLSFTQFLTPPLTTIHQPKSEMGKKAAELLLDRIQKRTTGPELEVILENHLIERSSCRALSNNTKTIVSAPVGATKGERTAE